MSTNNLQEIARPGESTKGSTENAGITGASLDANTKSGLDILKTMEANASSNGSADKHFGHCELFDGSGSQQSVGGRDPVGSGDKGPIYGAHPPEAITSATLNPGASGSGAGDGTLPTTGIGSDNNSATNTPTGDNAAPTTANNAGDTAVASSSNPGDTAVASSSNPGDTAVASSSNPGDTAVASSSNPGDTPVASSSNPGDTAGATVSSTDSSSTLTPQQLEAALIGGAGALDQQAMNMINGGNTAGAYLDLSLAVDLSQLAENISQGSGDSPIQPGTPVASPGSSDSTTTSPTQTGDNPVTTTPSSGDSTTTSPTPTGDNPVTTTPSSGDSTTTSPTPTGDSPVATTPGSGDSTTTAPTSTGDSPVSTTSGSGSPTTPPTSDSPTPAPTTSTPGTYSAIGPTGDVVGSTATTFGTGALPEASQSAPGFYVSADGSATGNGSEADPFATLQQAQQAMENSSIKTTYVEGGTYNQSSALNLTSADSGESFIGIGGSSNPAILDGGGTSGSIISVNGANNITVEGMQMQNTQQNLWAYSSQDAAISALNSTGDNFSYNTVSNVGVAYNMGNVTDSKFDGNAINDVQQAMAMTPGDSNDTIDSNSITNVSNVTGGDQSGAINMEATTNTTVSNNYFNNIAASAVEMCNWGGVSPNNDTVTQNSVFNTDTAATASSTYNSTGTNPSDMGAIYVWQGVGNDSDNLNLNITNNYVMNSGKGESNYSIYADDGSSDVNITGNILEPGGNNASAVMLHGGNDINLANNVINLDSSSAAESAVTLQNDGPTMTGDKVNGNDIVATNGNSAYKNWSIPTNNIPQDISGNVYSGVSETLDSDPDNETIQFADPGTANYTLVGF